jgi:hypothetical protein
MVQTRQQMATGARIPGLAKRATRVAHFAERNQERAMIRELQTIKVCWAFESDSSHAAKRGAFIRQRRKFSFSWGFDVAAEQFTEQCGFVQGLNPLEKRRSYAVAKDTLHKT